jgi:sugar fermentation stimulation protein A
VRYPSPLVPGVLRRRYQRFLADVELPGGEVVVAHVPNSGSMAGCSSPGSLCWLSRATGAHRRLAWTLEQVIEGGVPVGVNTARANGLALEALREGVLTLPGLESPWTAQREVRTAGRSRLDLRLEDWRGPYWVEVKNVTWVERGVALFPDARTTRGARHLEELVQLARGGQRAALVYVVQRGDATAVAAAARVDPAYAAALDLAAAAGVAVVAVEIAVTAEALTPTRPLPVRVEPSR